MGSRASKSTIKSTPRSNYNNNRNDGGNNRRPELSCGEINIRLQQHKDIYEKQYHKLENEHKRLQEDFIALKKRYDEEITNYEDIVKHANEVNKKLEAAFYETKSNHNLVKNSRACDTDDIHDCDINNDNDNDNDSNNDVDSSSNGKQSEMNAFDERTERLERELQHLLSESNNKDEEINVLRLELDRRRMEQEEEKAKIHDDYNTKSLLLTERYEEEKKEMNSLWEKKFTEVINNCNQDITNYRIKLNNEKSSLTEKLRKAMIELNVLEKKNRLLNALFIEIRQRYEARESRSEDLEKIADLEGQLIIQAEELKKQKDLLKNVKLQSRDVKDSIINMNSGNTGKNNKKNARRRRKRLANAC